MYQRRPRRFRRRTNSRNKNLHDGSNVQRLRTNPFNNGQSRNKFGNSLSAEKLFEKYSTLAKEAMSSGDKTLSENYYQHADHFIRIIEDRNKNRIQNEKENAHHKSSSEEKKNQKVQRIKKILI